MLILPQLVTLKWNPKIKQHLVDRDYFFTNMGDELEVYVLDLKIGNTLNVEVFCDYCENIYVRRYCDYNKSIDGTDIEKYCCKNCSSKKSRLSRKLSYEYVYDFFKERGCILLSNEYINVSELLDYTCKCGESSKISFSSFQRGSRCKECGSLKRAETTKTPFAYILQLFEDEDYVLLSSEYHRNKKLEFICNNGHLGEVELRHFKGGIRCFDCALENRNELQRHSYEYVEKIFFDRGCRLISDKYQSVNLKLDYHCKCGNETASATLNNFLRNSGCNNCQSSSKGEDIIESYLRNKNMFFKKQFKFQDCRDINPLLFDFAVFNNDKVLIGLIEFDGKQHFESIEFFGGEETFKSLQKRDLIKTNYSIKNNIPLLRICYLDIENIEKILDQQFEKLTKDAKEASFFISKIKEAI